MTTTIPLAQNWPEMLAMVAGYIGRTPPLEDDTPAAALRAKIEAALSEAPIPIAFNRLAQAIYDAGDVADDEVKAIGVAIMGGLSMMGTQNIGALREDLTAMRYVLMRGNRRAAADRRDLFACRGRPVAQRRTEAGRDACRA